MVDYFSIHCGQTTQPWSIIGNDNSMDVTFRSDFRTRGILWTGFFAVWTAVTEPPTYTFDCRDCIFPFVINERILIDTCTSIDGDNPWCRLPDSFVPPAPQTSEGTHDFSTKFYCSDSDYYCPSTPQMSTHTNNQVGNCCKLSIFNIVCLRTTYPYPVLFFRLSCT